MAIASASEANGSPRRSLPQLYLSARAAGSISLVTHRLYNDLPAVGTPLPGPLLQLQGSRAVCHRQPGMGSRTAAGAKRSAANLSRGQYNGYMSPATRRVFVRAIRCWLSCIHVYRSTVMAKWDRGRPYPTMVTLTLPIPQHHSDRDIYRSCLMPWLQRMRRSYGIVHYVWRAEAQENGNLHYHVLLDRYVDKRILQLTWCMDLDALDYRADYAAETGSLTPPCTHVTRIKSSVKDPVTGESHAIDPANYLAEYVSDLPQPVREGGKDLLDANGRKVLQGSYTNADGVKVTYITRPIAGRVWGMSDDLRPLRHPTLTASRRLYKCLENAVDAGDLSVNDGDHASVYYGPVKQIMAKQLPRISALVRHFQLRQFAQLYPQHCSAHYHVSWPVVDVDLAMICTATGRWVYRSSPSELADQRSAKVILESEMKLSWEHGLARLVPRSEHGYRMWRSRSRYRQLGLISPSAPALSLKPSFL